MTRSTIDYGIDLGTTNSAIALLNGTSPEVVQSIGDVGSIVTPSAVWFDKRGREYVGRKARENYFGYVDWNASPPVIGEDSGSLEFKLQMGSERKKQFRFIDRELSPEALSAKVLMALKSDVQTSKGEDLQAAVVTVPAAFELPQCDATRRAAKLAGFVHSPLLMEPVAAALAYGFQSVANNVFWLVYDFGGGTFDAAIVQIRDGEIQVVNHAGDNYLGGKNVDWDIVEKLLLPQLARQYRLDVGKITRSRAAVDIRYVLNLLKYRAEEAKIQVSLTRKPQEISVEGLRLPGLTKPIDFLYELTPADLEDLTEPWVTQSINLCKKALTEKRLSGHDMEKIILVGGTSLFPWLRERVTGELGATLDFSIDPITVVARGAAVFAGTQRLEAARGPVAAGTHEIQLEYEPVGSVLDPTIGARVTPPLGASVAGLSVEIIEQRSQWRSGVIRLTVDGTFMTEIHAEKGRTCQYQIVLTDGRGSRLPCSPDRFPYTWGIVMTDPPLPHYFGIEIEDGTPAFLFKKGEPLPAAEALERRITCNTKVALVRAKAYHRDKNVIRIPLIEGDDTVRADRNRLVHALEIRPDDPRVKRDVPIGSEIDVTIAINRSRNTNVKVYVPILDEEFEFDTKAFFDEVKTVADLQSELTLECNRLAQLRQQADETGDEQANLALAKIEEENTVDMVERTVSAVKGAQAESAEADKKLRDLKSAVDAVENALRWPTLVEEARQLLEWTKATIERCGTNDEKARLRKLNSEIEQGIADSRVELVRTRLQDLTDLYRDVSGRDSVFWIGYLEYLQSREAHMGDRTVATRLFAQAQQAIETEDIEKLKGAVQQLRRQLPDEDSKEAESRGYGSNVELARRI